MRLDARINSPLVLAVVLLAWTSISIVVVAFTTPFALPSRFTIISSVQRQHPLQASSFRQESDDDDGVKDCTSLSLVTEDKTRRRVLSLPFAAAAAAGAASSSWFPQESVADTTLTAEPNIALPMKEFVDPLGLFSIRVPKDFFTLRRQAKGDLPDEKTGIGRRGSSIFTAGNMAKAEVIAVERYPTRVLLEENGIQATGSLSTFPDLGEPAAIANLIILRRDRDKPGTTNTQILPDSLFLSQDGKELTFKLKTEIDVQKPELLMETYGVNALFRVTSAKASLRSNDGQLLAVFSSALEKDFMGPDGVALQDAVNSFVAIDRST